jgi:hypothetical protein
VSEGLADGAVETAGEVLASGLPLGETLAEGEADGLGMALGDGLVPGETLGPLDGVGPGDAEAPGDTDAPGERVAPGEGLLRLVVTVSLPLTAAGGVTPWQANAANVRVVSISACRDLILTGILRDRLVELLFLYPGPSVTNRRIVVG